MKLVLGRIEAGAQNLVFFPCKVAGDGDETLLCAAGAAAVVSGSNRFLPCVLQRVDANRGVMAAWMCRCCCKTRCNGLHECCMGLVLGRKPEHETLCFSV